MRTASWCGIALWGTVIGPAFAAGQEFRFVRFSEPGFEARDAAPSEADLAEPIELYPRGGYLQTVAFRQPPTPTDEALPELPEVTVTPRPQPRYRPSFPGYQGGFPTWGIPWNSDWIVSDQQRVGPYNQPVWTTQRPFAASRVYVLPPGQAQVEQWVRPTWERTGKPEFRMLEEVAIGLPGRIQIDLYERWNIEPDANDRQQANHEGVQIEVRWALADWGRIPFNPTLYAEWVERGGPQEKPNKYELKLLLAQEVFRSWYYASNLILEQETSGERETELGWSHALSTTIIERKLMAGVETVASRTTITGSRSSADIVCLAGPSMQFRPTNRSFLNVVGLFGTTSEPFCQMYVIYGWQFGTRAGPARGYLGGPASTIAN